jgi:hypothetical protein
MTVYSQNYTKLINTLCGKNLELRNISTGGMHVHVHRVPRNSEPTY